MAGQGRPGMHPVDAQMLEQLGAIVAVVDPVPAELVEMGRQLFAFRDPDAALLEAVVVDHPGDGDEATGSGAPVLLAVRSGWPSRMHFFEFEEVSLDIELTVGDAFCAVLGAVTTVTGEAVPTGWSVVLETTSESYTCAVGEDGRFAFERVPLGMVRLHLDRGEDTRPTSPWLDAR